MKTKEFFQKCFPGVKKPPKTQGLHEGLVLWRPGGPPSLQLPSSLAELGRLAPMCEDGPQQHVVVSCRF